MSVHPAGNPISCSTQAGFRRSLFAACLCVASVKLTPSWALVFGLPIRLPLDLPSPCVGVGHKSLRPLPRLPSISLLPPLLSLDSGVGHILAIPSNDGLPLVAYSVLPSCGHPLFDVPYGVALGVGH